MTRFFLILILPLLLSFQSIREDEPWVFVSIPDFLNVDCDYPEPLWEDALSYVLKSVKSENPDFIVVPGDVVMGHWDAPNWNDKDTIAKYAKRYYTAWDNRMKDHGLKYYVAIGDHEVGDNPWIKKKKFDAVKLYKEAFRDYFRMPGNGPAHMKGTAYWWRHKNTLFVSVDVFEKGESSEGMLKAGVTGEQLEWLRKVLKENDDVNHRIIMGHTPVLGPVRQWSSSGLMIEEGRDSDFWKLMAEYDVDTYLCGEVHAVTCTERDGIMQVAHGGLIGYNTRTNYLVCKVFEDRIEMEIKEIEMLPSGEHKWQTKNNRPLERVTITDQDKEKGFYKIGTLTIDKSKGKVFTNRRGYFKKELESSSIFAVPIFKADNRQGHSTRLPKITLDQPRPEKLSNGLVEISINKNKGTFDILDLRNNRTIIQSSSIGFTTKPYVDLKSLSRIAVETDQPYSEYSSLDAVNSTRISSPVVPSFEGGNSLSMISRLEGVGELEVQFTLYPDSSFVELGFSFQNLGYKPVRLNRIEVINGTIMPELDPSEMMSLDGNSGAGRTEVIKPGNTETQNNVLCFYPDEEDEASLVAGGLTYWDYRKGVKVSGGTIVLYATDVVGKRVDPGSTYARGDAFYLDGLTSNPFEALESYAEVSEQARDIDLHYYTFPSTCMWFLSVTHFGADATSENSTVGAVKEMEHIKKTGFLKYSPVAVRLVPDNYEQNNQQGWWDDEHWQLHGRKYRCVVDHHYKPPYETTKKWAAKMREMGGIPLTYFQPGIRSEDYAEAFPEHMLYNESQRFVRKNKQPVSDPHTLMGIGGIPDLLNPDDWIDGWGKLYAESYDFTDHGFLKHWTEVNLNLKNGGVQGVFYDYPDRAFPQRGGLEDRYSTATNAYRNVFRIAREVLGPGAYLQERIGPGSDATLDLVSSVRTEGDTNVINTRILNKAANRWYKNRLLTNYDMDGKALVEAGYGEHRYEIGPVQRKSILTLSYAVSGRLLLTESFSKFSAEVLYDLSRVFPFHSTPLSARPLHAFIGGMPILDFPVSHRWHQLILYNDSEDNENFDVPINGNTASGALGMDQYEDYYLYDFWNDKYLGLVKGTESISQQVGPGEARMISVHAKEANPQWITTNRHVMQGYVDLVEKPEWDGSQKKLYGVSSVVGQEEYRITIALNGFVPEKVLAEGVEAKIVLRKDNPVLADIILGTEANTNVLWEVFFN